MADNNANENKIGQLLEDTADEIVRTLPEDSIEWGLWAVHLLELLEARAKELGPDGESEAEAMVLVALDGVIEIVDQYPLYSGG